MLRISFDTFGNHNFDKGVEHLRRMVALSRNASLPGTPFHYVISNLENREQELPGTLDRAITTLGGVRVGIVGIMSTELYTMVPPGRSVIFLFFRRMFFYYLFCLMRFLVTFAIESIGCLFV
jgi:2',3'-cyclic-nucleotide 2'-phosphodiesterase (5'-nucleotidase family)